jgi:hypothetical protein
MGTPQLSADQVVRYLTSSIAAELHPTQYRKRSGAYSIRVHKFSLQVTVMILPISHIPQWRILMYEAYVRIRTTDPIWMGSVRHSAEYVVCSRRIAMPLHIMGSVGRIRPYTGDDLLGRLRVQWTTGLRFEAWRLKEKRPVDETSPLCVNSTKHAQITYNKGHRYVEIYSIGFWRWCATLINTGFLDFVHRPETQC